MRVSRTYPLELMERRADTGAVYSTGSRGDSYDNVLAESFPRPVQNRTHPPE